MSGSEVEAAPGDEFRDRRKKLAAALGPVGLWSFAFDLLTASKSREILAEIEELGFPVLWIPEGARSKEVLSHAGLLLSLTSRLVVATGIANLWARDPPAMAGGAKLLTEAYPGRFVLGIGVSHSIAVERRGRRYRHPVAAMGRYLDGMERARYGGPEPPRPPSIVLAALGPRMLALAAERALGAHTYFVPVIHTARARAALGEHGVLAVEQAVVAETDPQRARAFGREYTRPYLRLDNYRNSLLRLGFAQEELEAGGSDRLVDAIVAWGEPETIRARIHAHHRAGADHVAVQVLPRGAPDNPMEDLRPLAPALLG
ncbi:MAG: TIGR03620 family F420-dependent LLM class oxidoreductase [Actinomycetota bacterium]